MSEAENLLNQLSDDISVATADPSTEEHIVIDSNRNVYVPESLRRIAVQYDHNIERVTFDCPRYWDGIDMSEMKVYINYRRSDGKIGKYNAETVTIDDADTNIMHFEWVISRNVTEAKGPLLLLVCINTVDDEGNEVHHWHSELNRQMTVSEGLEVDTEIEDMYPDIITQLLLRMDNVEADNAATRDYIDDGLRTEVNNVVNDMVYNGQITGVDLSGHVTTEQLNGTANELNEKIHTTAEDITAIQTRLDADEQSIQTNAKIIGEVNDFVSDVNTDVAELTDKVNAMADYIVECGTEPAQTYSETYDYELWNSGKAIAETQLLAEASSAVGYNQIRVDMGQIPKILLNKPYYVYLSTCIDQSVTPRPLTGEYTMDYDYGAKQVLIETPENFDGTESILINVCIRGRWK